MGRWKGKGGRNVGEIVGRWKGKRGRKVREGERLESVNIKKINVKNNYRKIGKKKDNDVNADMA